MAALLVLPLLLLALAAPRAAPREVPVDVEYLYPPFNLTYFHFIDTNGVFLVSRNANFSAAVYNAGADPSSDQQSRFFFSVLHADSRTPVWTATAGATILQSIVLSLTAQGLALSDPAAPATPSWATPRLSAPVASLRLLDTGELALLDAANATLWSSFELPTDTLVPGQTLRAGVPITAAASDQDLNPGAYRLLLTSTDALLQWATANGSFLTYWALSTDTASVHDSNDAVHSMAVNSSGLYLFAANGRDTVFRLPFPSPPANGEPRLLKLDPSGRLRALSIAYSSTATRATLPTVWAAPADGCDLPLPCRSLGLCTPGTNGTSCSCPDAFSTYSSGGCSPADGSALPDSCAAAGSPPPFNYMSLGKGIGYFANKFASPATSGEELPACRDLCSTNCFCLGFFYRNSSKSCYLVQNQIGSVFRGDNSDAAVGFIKTLLPPSRRQGGSKESSLSFITIVFGIALPTVAAVSIGFLVYVMGAQWVRRRQLAEKQGGKRDGNRSWFKLPMLSSPQASSISEGQGQGESDGDEVLIPGLPARFTYAELEAATDGFKSQIGSGGFGSVYRGELPADRSAVAVKRMNTLGSQGRREFLTEIAQQQSRSDSSGGGAPSPEGGGYFPALALELHEEGRYEALVDPRLEGRADAAQVARVVRVALCCLHEDAALRPAMTTVSAMLDGSMAPGVPRTELLGYLRLYGRGLVDFRSGGKGKGSDFSGAGASSSWSPTSCVSAQQLSGPR
ncbi:hypothetical protein ABZP36_033414 [Zizania latifolia]